MDRAYKISETPETFGRFVDTEVRPRPNMTITYPKRNFIPNQLKLNTRRRRMILCKITTTDPFDAISYLKLQKHERLTMHLIRGRIKILGGGRNSDESIQPIQFSFQELFIDRLTYHFQETMEVLMIHSQLERWKSTVMCFEIFTDQMEITEISIPKPEMQYVHTIETKDLKRRRSVITVPISKQEAEEKTLILDAEMAIDKDNVSRPIQVSIINLKGEMLMNTYVTPKECIKRYCTWVHGISERKVIGRMDEDDCISKVRGLLRGKILMGCDLQGDIKALNIKVEELLGIRDISGSIAIQEILKNPNPLNGLKKMAQEILNVSMQERYHSANEDTEIIRKIYLKIRNKWVDHKGTTVEENENVVKESECKINPKINEPMEQ